MLFISITTKQHGMNMFKSFLPALAGAVTLNLLHELMRRRDREAPEINKIGEEALSKTIKGNGMEPPKGDQLYALTLAGDVLANTAYYKMIGGNTTRDTLWKGLLYGIMAGVGTLTLTKPLGLDDEPVNKSKKAQGLTMLYYIAGGLVTAGVYAAINNKRSK